MVSFLTVLRAGTALLHPHAPGDAHPRSAGILCGPATNPRERPADPRHTSAKAVVMFSRSASQQRGRSVQDT